MKAKATVVAFVTILITGIVLKAIMTAFGVQITGPIWGIILFGLMSGFAAIGIWEFFKGVFK